MIFRRTTPPSLNWVPPLDQPGSLSGDYHETWIEVAPGKVFWASIATYRPGIVEWMAGTQEGNYQPSHSPGSWPSTVEERGTAKTNEKAGCAAAAWIGTVMRKMASR